MPTKPPRHGQPKRPRHVHHYARPEELREFYGSIRWRSVSEQYRREHPLCADLFGTHAAEGVAEPVAHVHHIQPLRLNIAAGLDMDNLMSLCEACHARTEAAIRSRGTARHDAHQQHRFTPAAAAAVIAAISLLSAADAPARNGGGDK